MFFFEKKNQKTFISALAARGRPWPDSWERRENKVFLLLFFQKKKVLLPSSVHGRDLSAYVQKSPDGFSINYQRGLPVKAGFPVDGGKMAAHGGAAQSAQGGDVGGFGALEKGREHLGFLRRQA
jgi:hypothetical protein